MTYQNLIQVFEQSAAKHLQNPCFQFCERGEWKSLSWSEVKSKVQRMALTLSRLGVQKGERVCVLSKTRYEWTVADLAILTAGAVTVPIYESNTPEQVEFILRDSEAKIIFVENEMQWQKVNAVWKNAPHLRAVILFESRDALLQEGCVLSWRESLLTADSKAAVTLYQHALDGVQPQDMASIVYTSGTTGNPKGAVLTHDNFLAAIEAGNQVFPFRASLVSLMFLPLAHILGRITQFYQIANGFINAYAESIEKLIDNIATVRPHMMVSVPRIFEKVHERSLFSLQSASSAKKAIFAWAMAVGERVTVYTQKGKPVPLFLRLQNAVAHILVFAKLKTKLGGRLEFCISGGAPLATDVAQFFAACGLVILEGYGLTETTAANVVNRIGDSKIGTVGKVLPGVGLRIADDGEILLKGRVIFREYFKNPTATAEALEPDGWFHTGDIGELDADGFLKITDRKKELIVTAGGKKVAPQYLENLLKTSPYISQAVVHGDKRKFISALLTLNKDMVVQFAKNEKIEFARYEDLVQDSKIYALIKGAVENVNSKLAQYESVKKFAILPSEFTLDTGELTPSLKIKRKVVNEKYKEIFDRFYQE